MPAAATASRLPAQAAAVGALVQLLLVPLAAARGFVACHTLLWTTLLWLRLALAAASAPLAICRRRMDPLVCIYQDCVVRKQQLLNFDTVDSSVLLGVSKERVTP